MNNGKKRRGERLDLQGDSLTQPLVSEFWARENVEVRVVTVDRYGRTVGHVWIGDRHINREMVRQGHAWVYRNYLDDKTMLDDETYAQNNNLGLWSLPEAQRVPPWDWRRDKRKARPKAESVPDETFACGT